jgi:ketosteroid isomerase-like protein
MDDCSERKGDNRIAKGTFLNVLKKLPNGEWKISHHMWDDPVAPRQ